MVAADVYFDNVAVSAPQTQDASNNFWGAGPHVRLDVCRCLALINAFDIAGPVWPSLWSPRPRFCEGS
jgi:hypothetical protein